MGKITREDDVLKKNNTPLVKLLEDNNLYVKSVVAGQIFSISEQAVDKWLRTNQIEKETGAWIDLKKFVSARNGIYEEERKDLSDTARKLKAEADYKTSKARQEEMVALQMMGELIPQEEVKDNLENLFIEIRQKLLTLPDTIKSLVYQIDPLIATEVEKITNEVVRDLLKRLATGDDGKGTREMGEKPKRHYKKRKISVSTTD